MSSWLDNTEVAAGLVFTKKISAHVVDPASFAPPYDKMMKKLKDGTDLSELMADNFGAVNAAMKAVDAVAPGLDPDALLGVLNRSRVKAEAADVFMRESRKLERGEDVNRENIMSLMERMDGGDDVFTPLSDVKTEEIVFAKTHYDPIDKHIGGIPDSCLTIIAAPPGTGKTSLLAKIAIAKAAKEKKKIVLLFSLEMTLGQLLARFIQVGAPTKEVHSRIHASEDPLTIDEIDVVARRKCASENVSLIGIDFADMTVVGEKNSAAMEMVYVKCALLAKATGVPVILLAQLNDKYVGGLPRVNHIRWSRMADAVARLILLIYNPGRIWVDQGEDRKENPLPNTPGRGYLIVGKCLGKGTKVVMYDGALRNVEDVVVGDKLMGPDSMPRRVLSTAQGTGPMYTIKQKRALTYKVNANHVLSLKWRANSAYARYKKNNELMDIALMDFLDFPKTKQQSLVGYKCAVEFPYKEAAIHPYLLGVWLGDGTSSQASLTVGKDGMDVVRKLQGMGVPLRRQHVNNGTSLFYLSDGIRRTPQDASRAFTIQAKLRSIGVLNNKHIPLDYLANSRASRMELLAGLIDTDGHKTKGHIYEITQKNRRLAEDIKFLADSLGLRTSIHRRMAKSQNGTKVEVSRVMIGGDALSECPIAIERKKYGGFKRTMDSRTTGIDVEDAGVDEYYGFTLDGDGRFLLEDFTVTHNSSFGTAHEGVGAISVDWDGRTAWGDKAHGWYEL